MIRGRHAGKSPKEFSARRLTRQNSANYSVRMLERLDTLEAKLAQLIERYQATHAENERLRQQAIALENANKLLGERLDEARERLQALYDKIPD
jgi:biotin synthase-related radical SAM superfamily protein